jgi:hypothetical protein
MSDSGQTPSASHIALREWWMYTGQTGTPAPNAQQAVQQLKQRYRLSLPADFEDYLLHTAPGKSLWDNGDINWWPPQEIISLPEGYEHRLSSDAIAGEADGYLLFADYLIWCWGWAVCCSGGPNHGKVALIGGDPDRIIADSFSEFVERYLHDSDSVANQAARNDPKLRHPGRESTPPYRCPSIAVLASKGGL